jgi:ribosomal protein S27AE
MTVVATTKDKMICPDCGVEMNHHCDKLVYTTGSHDGGQIDPELGGLIEEFHACPKCGGGGSRPA